MKYMDILLAAVLVGYLSISKCFGRVDQVDCTVDARKPAKDTLKQMYSKWLEEGNDLHASFQFIPPLYKTRLKGQYSNASTECNLKTMRIYGDPKCHRKLDATSNNLMDISLCPWYVEMTYDPDRYPERLASARCKCKHCYRANGSKYKRSNRSDIPRCKEIKQLTRVLRIQKNPKGDKVCQPNNNKLFLYKESYEEIAVGCTCALKGDKRVQQNNFRTGS